jgi:hypothetical protein
VISERQARHLLACCESRLRRQLVDLRRRMQSETPRPALWELLMLDAVLHAENCADHEPHAGSPDIVIGSPNERRLHLECAWTTPPQNINRESLNSFVDWVRRQVRERLPGTHLNLRLEPKNPVEPVCVPPEHQRKSVTKSSGWASFIDAVAKSVPAALTLEHHNLRIIVEGSSRGKTVWTSGTVLEAVEHPEHHPVYRTIRSKAMQAKRWLDQGGTYEPLVLVIGADEGLAYIDPSGCGSVTLKQAVYSALLHETADPITRYNSAGSWPSLKPRNRHSPLEICGPRIRVSHSHLIGAVAVVQFKNSFGPLGTSPSRRGHVTVFPNPDPRASFNRRDFDRLGKCLDMNRVEYAAGSECWDFDCDPHTSLPASRSRWRGGRLITRGGLKMPSEIEIPAVLLHRILAGDLTANEAWKKCSTDILERFSEALSAGREIEHVAYVPMPPRSREEPRVCIRFGPPQPPLIRVKRVSRGEREGGVRTGREGTVSD